MKQPKPDILLFEGMISIRSLIESMQRGITDRKIEVLYYDTQRAEKERKELAWLAHRAAELGFEIRPTERAELDEMATGSTHGGVIAKVTERAFPPLTEKVIEKNGFYLYIDGIEDPYNFGFSLRSAYAMGVSGIILPENHRISASGIVQRASAGAAERIPTFSASPADAARLFKKAGYRIAAADLRDAVSCADADLTLPLFLIVGGEKRGISRAVLDLCDLTVKIDYASDFDQSLSAESAVSMMVYEVMRQNRGK